MIVITLAGMLLMSGSAMAETQEVLEIDIDGMTCTFCAYGIEKNLGELDGVEEVDVSLKLKKARVTMKAGESADEKRIREIILDGGFTPKEIIRHRKES